MVRKWVWPTIKKKYCAGIAWHCKILFGNAQAGHSLKVTTNTMMTNNVIMLYVIRLWNCFRSILMCCCWCDSWMQDLWQTMLVNSWEIKTYLIRTLLKGSWLILYNGNTWLLNTKYNMLNDILHLTNIIINFKSLSTKVCIKEILMLEFKVELIWGFFSSTPHLILTFLYLFTFHTYMTYN